MIRDLYELALAVGHAAWETFGRILTAVLLIPACIVMFFLMVGRLELAGSTVILVGLAWMAACLGGIIMAINPNKVAASILTMVGVFLGLTTVSHLAPKVAPGTTGAVTKLASYGDKQAKRKADRLVQKVRRAFPCDASNWQSFDWFATDEENGERVATMWVTEYDGRIWCFDGAGHDSLHGQELEPASDQTVRRISAQQPLRPPVVERVSAVPPLPMVHAPAPEPTFGPEQTITIPRPTS